jgi:2-oxoglutarate ferredoxin oxidoreductase subunit alpha
VIEQNRDGQMLSLLKLDLPATEVTKLRSIRYFDGLPLDARTVTDKLVLQEEI